MANPLEQFYNDVIKIVSKESGQISKDIKANVSPDKIQTYDTDVEAVEGDFIVRELPNDKTERYEILEVNYHKGLLVIPPFYAFKVRKTTAIKSIIQTKHIYNVIGNNARVYQNSIDNSVNTINIDNVFDKLKELINAEISEKSALLALINDMEKTQSRPSYLEKYKEFMIAAAAHMTIIAPFIPSLTSLIMNP